MCCKNMKEELGRKKWEREGKVTKVGRVESDEEIQGREDDWKDHISLALPMNPFLQMSPAQPMVT